MLASGHPFCQRTAACDLVEQSVVRGGQRQSMINDELRNKLHMQYAALRRYNASIESDGYVTAHQTNDGGHLT